MQEEMKSNKISKKQINLIDYRLPRRRRKEEGGGGGGDLVKFEIYTELKCILKITLGGEDDKWT